jgi:hypothetical protein
MNEFDPLEAELQALRPREPSPDLKRRLSERLDVARQPHVTRRRKSRWIGAVAGGLIAAGVAALIVWRKGNEVVGPPMPDIRIEAATAAAFDDSLPSFWSYRKALADSPAAVDALLDRHAAGNTELKPGRARVYFFARYDSDLNPLAGEL